MICYLDASALVKLYVSEAGSAGLRALLARARMVGTAVVSRAELGSALARAAREGVLTAEDAELTRALVDADWRDWVRLPVSELVVARAANFCWDQALRGYDAVQLAAAVTWQEVVDGPVTMVTYDRVLWSAAERVGLIPAPDDLPELLESWRSAD